MTPPPWSDSATTRSSMSVVGTPLRSMAAPTATWASWKASTPTSEPLLARPIGVRAAETITASVIGGPFGVGSVAVVGCVGSRIGPLGLALLGEGPRALRLVRVPPHRHQVEGARLAGVGEAELERPPQGPLAGGHGRRRVPGDLLGQGLGLLAEVLGWVDDLADHAQLVGSLGRHALVATHHGHPHDRLERHLAEQADGLERDHLPDRDVGVEE